MGRRTREQERDRSRNRRSKERSGKRIVNGLVVRDETTLRKYLESEGIYAYLNLVIALNDYFDKRCNEYKREEAKRAFEEIERFPRVRTGLLSRIKSSDEPLQTVKNPRDHFTEWRRAATQEEYDAWYEEQSGDYQPSQDLVADYEGLAEGVAELPTHGESGRVKPAPNLSQIEGVRGPVPPSRSKKPQK